MEPCYLPFDIDDWRAVPVIEERMATEEDVRYCDAVFSAEGKSKVVTTPGLPALAILTNANGSKAKVVIVQIETQIGDGMTVVGYVLPEGGSGIGTLSDVDIVEYSR